MRNAYVMGIIADIVDIADIMDIADIIVGIGRHIRCYRVSPLTI